MSHDTGTLEESAFLHTTLNKPSKTIMQTPTSQSLSSSTHRKNHTYVRTQQFTMAMFRN
jgi:hypothetical protein